MSLDIDAIKNKLNKLQKESSNNGGDSRSLYWKPQEGEQVVRIVPYPENPSNPFIEMYYHYNFGGEHLVSPLSYGDPDPIHEFSQKLRKQGDEESYTQSKRFEPKLRTHVPVIVRGEEDQGVRYWGFGKQVYEQLLGYIADPDWGDITHPSTGRDIKVTYEKPEGWPQNKSNGFPKTSIMPKPNKTKALDDLSKLKEMSEELPSLKKLNEPLSYAELEKKLKDYVKAGDSDVDAQSNGSPDASAGTNNKNEDKDDTPWTSDKEESDVESAFDDLFED